jgi:hypothetical protein
VRVFRLLDLNLKTRPLKVLFLVALTVLIATISAPATKAQPVDSLPVGSYWTLGIHIHNELTGSGSFNGTWSRNEKYAVTFSLLSHDSNTIIIRMNEAQDDSWSSTATDAWIKRNGGATNHGTVNPFTNDYTLDAATLQVIKVSNDLLNNSIGEYSYIMINPQGLSVGSDVPISADLDKVSSSESVSIKGASVDSWMLTWTGPREKGFWRDGTTYSRGPEMWVEYFDKTYGLRVADTIHGIYKFNGQGGGWRETKESTSQVSDTNINFSQSGSFFLMQPYVLGGMAVAVVVIVVAFLTIRKRKTIRAAPAKLRDRDRQRITLIQL